MTNGGYKETYIIKLGGSLIVPAEGIATTYLHQFQLFIRKQVAEHQRRFFIFVGGGLVARQYRDAGRAIEGHELPDEDDEYFRRDVVLDDGTTAECVPSYRCALGALAWL